MDHENHDWAATGLFSPSKARQQEAIAKDWSFIDNWLSKKYHPKQTPKFERNDDTLQALLTLAAFNDKADEEQELVERLEKSALVELQRVEEDTIKSKTLDTAIHNSLQASLSPNGRADLTAQSTSCVVLDSPYANAPLLAQTTVNLTASLFVLNEQLAQIETLYKSLLHQQSQLQNQLQSLKDPEFIPASDLPQRTAECNRQTKTLRAKLQEYDERLRSSGSASVPEQSLKDVEDAKANLARLQERLAGAERDIAVYEGLPPDKQEVRAVLENLRRELSAWTRRRDDLFEGLVKG